MIRLPAALAVFLLAGCANLAAYQPYVADVKDRKALADDEVACLARAEAYKAPLSGQAIASAALQGGAVNAASGVLNPLAPVLGSLGYASGEFLSELGLLSSAQRRVFLICLSHRGMRSGLYDVLDPNQ